MAVLLENGNTWYSLGNIHVEESSGDNRSFYLYAKRVGISTIWFTFVFVVQGGQVYGYCNQNISGSATSGSGSLSFSQLVYFHSNDSGNLNFQANEVGTLYYTTSGDVRTCSSTIEVNFTTSNCYWIDGTPFDGTTTDSPLRTEIKLPDRYQHKVSYYSEGGTGGILNQTTVTYQQNYFTLYISNSAVPTKSGYEFLGWSKNQDGSGTLYQPGEQISFDTTNGNLYAVWKSSQVTYIKTNNIWKEGQVYVKVSGQWKLGELKLKENNTWLPQ